MVCLTEVNVAKNVNFFCHLDMERGKNMNSASSIYIFFHFMEDLIYILLYFHFFGFNIYQSRKTRR